MDELNRWFIEVMPVHANRLEFTDYEEGVNAMSGGERRRLWSRLLRSADIRIT